MAAGRMPEPRSFGFEDNVAVGGGVAGSDEADGVGDAFFELEVRFAC